MTETALVLQREFASFAAVLRACGHEQIAQLADLWPARGRPQRGAPDAQDWVTVRQAAADASVTRRTIYNWLRLPDGPLITRRTPTGALRIQRTSLFRVIAEKREAA